MIVAAAWCSVTKPHHVMAEPGDLREIFSVVVGRYQQEEALAMTFHVGEVLGDITDEVQDPSSRPVPSDHRGRRFGERRGSVWRCSGQVVDAVGGCSMVIDGW